MHNPWVHQEGIPGRLNPAAWRKQAQDAAGPDQSHLWDTRLIWTPWGWAMDRSRLARLLASWCMGNSECFTCKIKAPQYRRTHRELFPVLSRI
jgi:hypothetical protein